VRVVSVVGARPQFVKLAPIAEAFARAGVDHKIIHTGQHYDPLLSDVFFSELSIPAPDVHLGVGSGTHGVQTGAILAALDTVLPSLSPDWVLVYGDTNSTLAAAVAAAKLHLPLAHLEAGLRSFNRILPEEHNRVLTDHAADLLLAPTDDAARHLANEGLRDRTVVVGDVMTDILLKVRDSVLDRTDFPTTAFGLEENEPYSIATIHRGENTDHSDRLEAILGALARVNHKVILLAHPRLKAWATQFNLPLTQGNLIGHDPLSYADLVCAVVNAQSVITDSGGLQKEAFLLRVPCTTVRAETEWEETLRLGWNVLVEPGDPIVEAVGRPRPSPTTATPYGDGHAADRVATVLANRRLN
jgi:UDP-N-acetylglucosamine 2-epimerase (non-hydrolysing)